MSDLLHTFLFEQIAVRGAIVQLDSVWRFMSSLRRYPAVVETLLGQSVVAAALLASVVKRTHGSLLLQMQGDGVLQLLLAECSNDYGLRGTARWSEGIAPAPLHALIGSGRCAITLGGPGSASYQGIVPLERATLARALEDYMARSEQLESRLLLFSDAQRVGGVLLQRIPQGSDTDPDDWNRICHLAHTLTAQEVHELAAPVLLRRIFPHDDLRLFDGRALRFACTCSAQRVHGMLSALGRAEVEEVIAEQGQIEVTCEFCGQVYRLSAQQSRALFE